MSAEIPIVSLIKKGSKTFPRYVLAKADEFKNAVFWNGSTWSDESEGERNRLHSLFSCNSNL